MNLYEHQSTYNPNLPIRGLIYLAHLYEEYIEDGQINLYSSGLKKLPFPQYFVFYNGTKKAPDRSFLKLSDAFQKTGKDIEPCLREYSQFVFIVREQKKLYEDPEEATLRAVEDEAYRETLLKEYDL